MLIYWQEINFYQLLNIWASQVVSVIKNLPLRDVGLNPGSGRSLRGGNGDPLQYSCLGKSHGQRSLVGTVHGTAKKSDVTSTATSNQKGQASFWSPYIWNRKQQAVVAGHQLSDRVFINVSFVLCSSASNAPVCTGLVKAMSEIALTLLTAPPYQFSICVCGFHFHLFLSLF